MCLAAFVEFSLQGNSVLSDSRLAPLKNEGGLDSLDITLKERE